jgi:antitoxin Phd
MRMEPKGRVLFVEGDSAALKIGAKHLDRAGFVMRFARGEPEALELEAKEPFDVLVVDLDVPKLDGLSLLRRLQERGSTAAVVWLASERINAIAAEATEVGVLQVLQKPVDALALERVVSAGVNRARHVLSVLRAIVRPSAPQHSVPATEAKNEFGSILETAVQDGAVVITKHDSPKAVLVSVDRMDALLAKHEPNLQALTHEFDKLVARMRTPKARAAARELFSTPPKQLGAAALVGAKKRRG